jgi:hypothetical protein
LSFSPGSGLEHFEPKEFGTEILNKLNLKKFHLKDLEKLDFLPDYRQICET